MHSVCQGFDWAGLESCAVVVDALTPLAIFLVVDGEGRTGGLEEVVKGGGVGNDEVPFSEDDVFDAELLGPSFLVGTSESVFSNP